MSLRVIQTYHGSGGKEGYKFEVEKFIEETGEFVLIGELIDFPTKEKIVSLKGINYEIIREYDCNDTTEDKEIEKVIIELKRYVPPKYFELKWKNK